MVVPCLPADAHRCHPASLFPPRGGTQQQKQQHQVAVDSHTRTHARTHAHGPTPTPNTHTHTRTRTHRCKMLTSRQPPRSGAERRGERARGGQEKQRRRRHGVTEARQ